MSDPAKIRLVRCPKCEKLLPELEGYSVYQCGGCGAVLRAKARNLEMDSLPQKSDEVVEENLYSKPENCNYPEKKNTVAEGSDNDVRSNTSSSGREEKRNENSKAEKLVVHDDLERDKTSHANIEGNLRNLGSSNGARIVSQQSETFGDWNRGAERGEIEGILGNRNHNFQALRFSSSIYPEDGPSNYASRPTYGRGERIQTRYGADELKKVEYLEQDRAVLLKKLDELKDQISRSCEINDKHKEKVPIDPRMARQGVNYTNKPSYATHYNIDSPYTTQMPRRAPRQEPNPYFSGHYIHEKMDPYLQSYPKDRNLHHPHCSCVHCYNNHSRVGVPPNAYQHKPSPHEPYNPMLYQNENRNLYGPLDYNSYNLRQNARWPNDLKSDVSGYGNLRSPRVVMTSGRRHCRPVVGGAPVVSCYNCFQLLEIPKNCSLSRMNHVKMKCGACSTIIIFAVANKKLIHVSADTDLVPNLVVKNPNFHAHVRANQASTLFSSEDYDNSGYDFQFLDREGQGYDSHKSENKRGFRSSSSFSSEHDVSVDMVSQEVIPNSAELEVKNVLSQPREKADLRKFMPRQNSIKDAALATEIDVSFNEDINAETSFESGDTGKDEDNVRGNKVGQPQSFLGGIIKKGLKDLSKSNTTVEKISTGVLINGYPLTDRLLKKAEKIAGPVHPGQYWYDYRAGFWGVMGGPCLGIIPPFIEEFNYPMPENCAGGDTCIYVNGRELHQKDLSLLSSRGLPSTEDRSYIIEINGRVLDEDTGEELPSLGKLAPTVEKVKHGFGMKVPRLAA